MNDAATKTKEPAVSKTVTPIVTTAASQMPSAPHERRPRRSREQGQRERRGKRGGRDERVRPEFDQKTLAVRRVARVVAGGRRFNFSVLLVLGNREGSVGVGLGKAADTALAMDKANKRAKREMIRVPRTKNRSIPHELDAKYSSALVVLRPAKGKGLVAGSAARAVLELAGVTDVNAKILSGSKNKLNIARATIKALSLLLTPRGSVDESPITKKQAPNN